MNISHHRRRLTSAVLWVPVSAIVAALFLVPDTSDASARAGSLTVSPAVNTTGGQLLNFSGDIGNGAQRIYLERRGSVGAQWARVPDPRPGPNHGDDVSVMTQADGTFSFDFPAPAMNACFFRLANNSAETEGHQFVSVHQDVEVKGSSTATVGVPYVLTGDTVLRVQDNRPIFPGRAAELQVRNGSDDWDTVANGTVGGDGKINDFPALTTNVAGTVVYRIRLADYQVGGDEIGWFPSLPFSVTVN